MNSSGEGVQLAGYIRCGSAQYDPIIIHEINCSIYMYGLVLWYSPWSASRYCPRLSDRTDENHGIPPPILGTRIWTGNSRTRVTSTKQWTADSGPNCSNSIRRGFESLSTPTLQCLHTMVQHIPILRSAKRYAEANQVASRGNVFGR
jgi:hypothetical protein